MPERIAFKSVYESAVVSIVLLCGCGSGSDSSTVDITAPDLSVESSGAPIGQLSVQQQSRGADSAVSLITTDPNPTGADESVSMLTPLSNGSDSSKPVTVRDTLRPDWTPPEGCIGDIDTDGTSFCVNVDTRLFSATAADGTLWWSFVLPGDSASNQIEAVFVFGDKVVLLADKYPGTSALDSPSAKVNPYEISTFERSGAFLSTVSLQQDLNESNFPDDETGHQLGQEPALVAIAGANHCVNCLKKLVPTI